MKTVGEFKKAGLQFVEGDVCVENSITYSDDWFKCTNRGDDWFYGFDLKSFAWRENTGVKPEFGGNVDVITENLDSGDCPSELCYASDLNWSNHCLNKIIKWRPSLNQPSVSESDTKEPAIHKAWVALKGDLSNAEKHDRGGRFLVVCIKDGISIKKGEYQIASHTTNNTEYWENVCAIPEFTDYCEKMAAEEKRIDIIGQNGNDGLHYDNTAQQVEALALKRPSEKMKVALKEADDIGGGLHHDIHGIVSDEFPDNGFVPRCVFVPITSLKTKVNDMKVSDKLIFTQAMADAGELPPVGSLVDVVGKNGSELAYGEGEKNCEVLAHIEDTAVIRMSFGLGCFSSNVLKASDTRTDREKAIDTAITVAHQDGQDYQYLKGSIEKLYDAGLLKC